MKYYKTLENEIYAYESDGSQDHLIVNTYIAITKEEADEMIKQKMQENLQNWQEEELTPQEQLANLQQQIDALKLKFG
jgi:hypothetical protein